MASFVGQEGVPPSWTYEEYAALLDKERDHRGPGPAPFVIPVLTEHGVPLPPFLRTRHKHLHTDVEPIALDILAGAFGQQWSARPALGELWTPDTAASARVVLSRDGDDVVLSWEGISSRVHLSPEGAASLRASLASASAVTRDLAGRSGAAEALARAGARLGDAFDSPLGHRLAQVVSPSGGHSTATVTFASADATLLCLPWEAARLPGDGPARPLALVPRLATVRELEGTAVRPAAGVDGPLRVLVALAAPGEELDIDHEAAVILDALERVHRGRAHLVFCDEGRATLDAIASALDHGERFHVLHVSAHGRPEALLFEDDDGGEAPVSPEKLSEVLLRHHAPPPLVVLSACLTSAMADEADRAHFAAVMLRSGVPQMVAMQHAVGDGYATELARHFYEALADVGDPVPADALAEARRRVEDARVAAAQKGQQFVAQDPEYATPVLYAAPGAGSARLFDGRRDWPAPPGRTDLQRDLSVSYNRLGDLHGALGHGDEAKRYYEAALAIAKTLAEPEPGRADLQRDLSVLYQRLGELHRALGNGDEAKRYYEADLAIAKTLAEREPERADLQGDLALSYERMAAVDSAGRCAWLDDAITIHRRRLAKDDRNARITRELAVVLIQRASGELGEFPQPNLLEGYSLLRLLADRSALDAQYVPVLKHLEDAGLHREMVGL